MKHTKMFGKGLLLLVVLTVLVIPIAAFAQGYGGEGHGRHGSSNWHLYGTITSMPEDGMIGEWAIDDEVFWADANTIFGNEYGELVIGADAHAVGNYVDESRVAYRVETIAGYQDCLCDCDDAWHLYGEVEAMPAEGLIGEWTIAGEKVSATADTIFRERFGTLEVGATVVSAGCADDGEAVANMIATVKDQDQGNGAGQCDGECDGSGGGSGGGTHGHGPGHRP